MRLYTRQFLINLQISRASWCVGTREIPSTAFGIFFDRESEGISTGLLLNLRVYLLSSVQVLISWLDPHGLTWPDS